MKTRTAINWFGGVTLVATLNCSPSTERANVTANVVAGQIATLLDSSQRQNTRAGMLPARVRGGEFGAIEAARISPDGRWIVVLDQVYPYIKVVNDSGFVSALVPLRAKMIGDDVERPALAISNKNIMLARSDLRRVELYDFNGKLESSIDSLTFTPITGTAINDSVWAWYGPSDAGTGKNGTWVHCLYLGLQSPHWKHAYVDRVMDEGNIGINTAAPYVRGDTMVMEHRQPWGSVVISAACGDRNAPLITAVRAYGPKAAKASPTVISATASPYLESDPFGGSALTNVAGALWTISAIDKTDLLFQQISGSEKSTSIRVVPTRSYQVLDSRDGLGVLIASFADVPALFLVPQSAIGNALKAGPPSISSVR